MPRFAGAPRPFVVLWTLAALLVCAGVLAGPAGAPVGPVPSSSLFHPAPLEVGAETATGAQGLTHQEVGPIATPFHQRLLSVFGLVAILLLAWLLSVDRRVVPWRVVAWGMGLQLLFALLILKTPVGLVVFAGLNDLVVALLGFAADGARFLFGNLVDQSVPVTGPGATPGMMAETGAYFAFTVLPTIIFFSSLMTALYHLGIMQRAVRGVAWLMTRTMRTSGAETLVAAGNIFVGQTEAPLLVKPFVERMTSSELMAVMTAGFATVAGGVMAAYVGMLVGVFPDIAGHLIAASVMSAPAALVVAKLMVPERDAPLTGSSLLVSAPREHANLIDAVTQGAGLGLRLAVNVGAMLMAFVALIALVNASLGLVAGWLGIESFLQARGVLGPGDGLTLELLLGWLMAPVAWVMGVPWSDAAEIGALLGVKTVANEFLAYLRLAAILSGDHTLSPRSVIIATYALAGFANFGSVAIQIGGIGSIAPGRRPDLARLGLRAMVGGLLAGFLTATVAGILL